MIRVIWKENKKSIWILCGLKLHPGKSNRKRKWMEQEQVNFLSLCFSGSRKLLNGIMTSRWQRERKWSIKCRWQRPVGICLGWACMKVNVGVGCWRKQLQIKSFSSEGRMKAGVDDYSWMEKMRFSSEWELSHCFKSLNHPNQWVILQDHSLRGPESPKHHSKPMETNLATTREVMRVSRAKRVVTAHRSISHFL